MPGTRCNASATDLSGKAPMSVAVIESTNVLASFLIACAVSSASRKPMTTTSSSLSPLLTFCAQAGVAPAAANIATETARCNAMLRRRARVAGLIAPPASLAVLASDVMTFDAAAFLT
jgi:hypothetical protein